MFTVKVRFSYCLKFLWWGLLRVWHVWTIECSDPWHVRPRLQHCITAGPDCRYCHHVKLWVTTQTNQEPPAAFKFDMIFFYTTIFPFKFIKGLSILDMMFACDVLLVSINLPAWDRRSIRSDQKNIIHWCQGDCRVDGFYVHVGVKTE